MRRKEGKK
uniref:Uncharacterized protein n=1 Tax=Anguilla anguilla TaxID=7936 RepID=A0A0E9TVP3_ANGAN